MFTTLISTSDLVKNLHHPDWVIVDCRFSLADTEAGRRAYREQHIPGAFYAHLDEDLSGEIIPGRTGRHPLPDVDILTRRFSGWGIDKKVQVVAYDDSSGAIAARLWWMLRWLGHEPAAVLNGGWQAWVKEERATDDQLPGRTSRVFTPRLQDDLLVDAGFVESIRNDPAYVLADSRTPERYRGEEEPIDPVAGHIPGAVNAPHPYNIRADGLFKSKEELRERFRSLLQGKPVDHAVFYCGSGVTACRNILAVEYAEMGKPKLYAGSWSEWITDEDRPVAP